MEQLVKFLLFSLLEVENMTDFMVCQDWKWGSIKNGLENI
jgi:hypothetical protein